MHNFWVRDKKIITGPAILIVIILVGFIGYQVNVKPLIPSIYSYRAYMLEGKDWDQSLKNYQKTLDSHSYLDWDMTNFVAERLLLALETKQIEKEDQDKILDFLVELEQPLIDGSRRPDTRYMFSRDFLIRIYNVVFSLRKDAQAPVLAEKIFKEVIDFNSQHPIFYQIFAQTKLLQKDYQEAINLLRERAKIRNNYVDFYKDVAKVCAKAGDKANQARAARKAVNLGYISGQYDLYYILTAGMLYEKRGDYETALQIYKKALEKYPDRYGSEQNLTPVEVFQRAFEKYSREGGPTNLLFLPQLYISLANTYLELGDREKALQAAKTLGTLPGYKSHVEEFLKLW